MLIYRQISPKFVSTQTVAQKIHVTQAQSTWLAFSEAVAYKRQEPVVLHTPDMNGVK